MDSIRRKIHRWKHQLNAEDKQGRPQVHTLIIERIKRHPHIKYILQKSTRLLGGLISLIIILAQFVPHEISGQYGTSIDDSYMQALHTAFLESMQFGKDFIFTYGPWGFLYGGYNPGTHSLALIIWIALSLLFWWTGWKIALHFSKNGLLSFLWIVTISLLAGLTLFQNIDVRLTGFVVFLLILHFHVDSSHPSTEQIITIIALSMIGLIKFTFLVLGGGIILLLGIDIVIRLKRFPWVIILYSAGIIFFWIISGQKWNLIGSYFHYSLLLQAGFTEAMMMARQDGTSAVIIFVILSVSLCGLIGYTGWKRHRYFGIIPIAGFSLIVFNAFKYGYVRHDGHEVTAVLTLLFCSIAILIIFTSNLRIGDQWLLRSLIIVIILIFIFASSTFRLYSSMGLPASILKSLSYDSIIDPLQTIWSDRSILNEYVTFDNNVRNKFPIPDMEGCVDSYPSNQDIILAHKYCYHPRPVIQSYCAYSPELAELNSSFLRSDRAPNSILFTVAPIDIHYPSLDDGLSWPDLLTRYDVMVGAKSYIYLKKSTNPRSWRLSQIQESQITFGKEIIIPQSTDCPIWATIDIERSFYGTFLSTLYKPPSLNMLIKTRDGKRRVYTLIRGMARSGFILSPLIQNNYSFTMLSSSEGIQKLIDNEVTAVTIMAETDSGDTACYAPNILIRLFSLHLSK